MIVFLILFLLFLIKYFDYRNELNKFQGREGIKVVIQNVELVDVYNKFEKKYNLTVMLQDCRCVVTEIISDSSVLGRRAIYTWVPSIGDEIIIYDNNDGTYDNNYKVILKKDVLKKLCIIYIFGIVLFSFFTFVL